MWRRELLLAAAAAPAASPADEPVKTIHSQPSWVISNRDVEAAITQLGGHMAPVSFDRASGRPVQPYHISPWQDEKIKVDVPVLVPLRGDFFCMPFGGGKEPNGREHPAHGETASARWSFAGLTRKDGVTTLTATIQTTVRPGKVIKRVSLAEGSNAVYTQHEINGFAGPTTPGHHATLRLPASDGALRVATSEFAYGTTHPAAFADPRQGEYQSFAVGAVIRDLAHVPLRFKDAVQDADMTALPARTGYVDLMAIYKRPGATPGWMAVVNHEEQYLWFSLKDPAVLPGTVFWLENRGRHGSPWSGRNRCLGLEDVCWYFDRSYEPNPVNKLGIPTTMTMGSKATFINYIQGAVRVPRGFDTVRSAVFAPGRVTFTSASGQSVSAAVRHEFLKTGRL
jgi:hypothetical protein